MVNNQPIEMGTVEVTLKYKRGELIVDLHRGKGIAGKRSQDTYAQVFLIDDDNNGKWDENQKVYFGNKEKTAVFSKNLNPEFDTTFTFKMENAALLKKSLVISIWDEDSSSRDDYMAGVTFPVMEVARFKKLGQRVDIDLQVQELDGYVSHFFISLHHDYSPACSSL